MAILCIFYCCSMTIVPIFPLLFSVSLPSTPQSIPTLLSCSWIIYTCSFTRPFPPPFLPHPSPVVAVSLFLVSIPLVLFCSFVCFVHSVPLIGEIIWYLFFAFWLISLIIMLASSTHAVAKGRTSFFLLCSIPLCKCTSFLTHSFTDEHVGYFQHLAIINNAAMNIVVPRFF